MNRGYALLLLAVLAGCAGYFKPVDRPVKPSDRVTKLKHGMDRRAAVALFAKHATPQPGNQGYCGSDKFSFESGTPISISDTGYSLHAYKAGELLSSEQQGNKTRYTYKKIAYEEVRKFASLLKIRIARTTAGYANCEKPAREEVMLSLYFGVSDFDVIMVAPANQDEMLAALMVLAPQAKVVQSSGYDRLF